MAVILGVRREVKNATDVVQYIVHPLLDTKRVEHLPHVVKMEIAYHVSKGIARKLKIFAGANEAAFGDWAKTLLIEVKPTPLEAGATRFDLK